MTSESKRSKKGDKEDGKKGGNLDRLIDRIESENAALRNLAKNLKKMKNIDTDTKGTSIES